MAEKKSGMSRKVVKLDTDVYTLALERINHIYDIFDHVAVAFSGGKDSTALLNIALQVARERGKMPLDVRFFDEEAVPMEVEHYVRRVSKWPDIDMKWYCLPVKHRNACNSDPDHQYWVAWNPWKKDLWVRDLPEEAITTLDGYEFTPSYFESIPKLTPLLFPPSQYGRVCWLMGIRAQESMTRRQAVVRHSVDNYIIEIQTGQWFGAVDWHYGNVCKGYPIYDWSFADIWTAVNKFDWDYCQAYDLMNLAGIPATRQRVAPPFGEQPSTSLWMYKVCFPDLWEKMVNRVPGASTAALYSRTELYSYGKRSKPMGMTWMQFVTKLIEEVDDKKARRKLAQLIRRNIRRHYKKTTNPILPHVVHPASGLSWDGLATIAGRKDTKGRIRIDFKAVPSDQIENFAKAMGKYRTALACYENRQAIQLGVKIDD